ncbi:2-oxoacid:ferredoxin oxidoreductase subunit beta [bacterium]|nr:2-oxoacid:ferredoxin oxidoreductase subunit beta [bacterium]
MIDIQSLNLTKKDFVTENEVRWCPGCGDYGILSSIQKTFASLGEKKENFAVISGIGCSSRFPYYMDTYGIHGIHGRAIPIATGVKLANPALSVWVITGDGDGISIGGNHFIHAMRRNVDVNVVLFNNRIYGLTKGQLSPTSELGKITKSSPFGSIDAPFNPATLALGAGAPFVARSLDRNMKHMSEMIRRAYQHFGATFIEVYQNCVIFNDGAFNNITDKETKDDFSLMLEHKKPMIFGKESSKGIHLDGNIPRAVEIGKDYSIDDILVHDETDSVISLILGEFTYRPDMPTPFGVIRAVDTKPYCKYMLDQIAEVKQKQGEGTLETLLSSGDTWEIK